MPKTEINKVKTPSAGFSISNWFKSSKPKVIVPTVPQTQIGIT